MISLLLLSCYYFSFAPGCVVSIFGGNQHSPDQGCSAESCRSGVFTGEDEHMSLHPTILCHKSFHARMDTIKDRNGMYLIEAEDINKRWQKYTKQCKKNTRFHRVFILIIYSGDIQKRRVRPVRRVISPVTRRTGRTRLFRK